MTRMAGSVKGVTDFLGIKPEYGVMGSQTIADTAREIAAITEGNALARNAGLKAEADMAAAQHYGAAEIAAGQAQGQASLVGGIASGIGGLAPLIPKGGFFNKSKGLSPEMQQASLGGGLNLGTGWNFKK
jgi:hypothetical protein